MGCRQRLRYLDPEVEWLDCTNDSETGQRIPQCQQPLRPGEFTLSLRKSSAAIDQVGVHQWPLGRSWIEKDGGVVSNVFPDAAPGLTEEMQGVVLGHAAAHEFGHLLLGQEPHTKQGIMHTNWNKEDWKSMACGWLYFSKEEARRMQDKLLSGQMQARN